MKSTEIARGILKALLAVLIIVLVLSVLYMGRTLIAYLTIAAVMALIGRPVVIFLRRRLKMPNTVAVALSLFFMLGIAIGIIAIIVPVLTDQGDNLKLLRIDDIQSEIDEISKKVSQSFGASPRTVEEIIEETDLEENVLKDVDMDFVPSLFGSVLTFLTSISVGLLSVLFISFFFLKDSKMIQRLILNILPRERESQTINSIMSIKNLLSRYFVGLVAQLAILFIFYVITLLFVGIENAVPIAFFCALFNVIPYVGPVIGGVVMMALTILNNIELDFETGILPLLGYVFIGVTVGQLVDNFFSQPFIFSNSVRSHPLEIFIIIVLAGLIFGVVGMIIAVPAYTVLKVISKEFLSHNRLVKYLTKDI